MPVPREFTPDFWNEVSSEDPGVTLTCLLPNGITVLVTTTYNATMAEVKVQLWEEARAYPLYGKLQADMAQYIFKIINSMAQGEELIDESRRLGDVRPTGGVLVVSECRLNSEEHSINIKIGHLIGKGLQDFDALNSSEINDFRFNMRTLGERIAKERDQLTWQQKLLYQFPPRLCETTDALLLKLTNVSTIIVEAKCEKDYSMSPEKQLGQEKLPYSQKFNVSPTIRPSQLLEKILAKKANTELNNERATDYVLKVCGRDEYLVKDYPLNQFQYVQDCIAERIIPSFLTVHTNRIPVAIDYGYVTTIDTRKPRSNTYTTNTLRKKKTLSSSRISDNYVLTIATASKLNCDTKKPTELGIQVGLFHGGKSLCQPIKTDEKLVSKMCEIAFNATIEFDIQVCNIPRCAKLCFVVYETNRYNKGTKSRRPKDPKDIPINPIAWANSSVYDFRGQLRTGTMTLYMWTYADDMMSEEALHPLGTVVSNPNTDYATALTLAFKNYDETIVYPDRLEILQYAKSIQKQESITIESTELCKRLIIDNENLYDVHDQDRKNVWQHREILKQSPEIFPKVLSCIDWDKRDEVSEVIALLDEMPRLPAEKALELLDYAYADQVVRSFAVKSLRAVSDEDLLLYLLQLVQAIKHELYLECDLVTFLLERALRNQKIGHFLFWHLRSEMQVPAVSVRFGLILEAYCRGSQDHIPMLQRQIKSIERLKKCYEKVKSRNNKEKAKAALKECLNNSDDKDSIRSPLDPSYRCSRLKVEKCRVMDSKMKPLWIVFENSDSYGDDVYIIFKNGDDLRQDMLTLQMIKIMDRLWKREGLDLRMNPYNCISLEHRVGMIQVVLNAETIANIQKEKNSAVLASFKKGSILAWLKDYNKNERTLSKAIEEFTLSCAGYCVATYVLGIADRHPDNIMIKTSGQLFHIDFGHILGHFKEKFGIKREHAPFVLTHDFVHVINKGQKEALEFKIFQGFCEKAFMILRKHGNLILSLFAMMISTGLPELTSEKDLQYLKETLVLSKTDDEALEHFRAKFNEALSNSWKTSLSWATHNVKRNNQV